MFTIILTAALAYIVGRIVGWKRGRKHGLMELPMMLAHERYHLERSLQKNVSAEPQMVIEIKCGKVVYRRCTIQEAAKRAALMDEAVRRLEQVLST